MFNFFNELKSNIKSVKDEAFKNYNLINVSGNLLYVEGHMGLVSLSKENISFRVRGATIVVDGEDMRLLEMTENTLKIIGKIKKVETL